MPMVRTSTLTQESTVNEYGEYVRRDEHVMNESYRNPDLAPDFGLLWNGHDACTDCEESTFQSITHRVHSIDPKIWELDTIMGPIFGYNVYDARLSLNASVIIVKPIGEPENYQVYFTLMDKDKVFDYSAYYTCYDPFLNNEAFSASSNQIILTGCGFNLPATSKFSKVGVESWVVESYIEDIVACVKISGNKKIRPKEYWSSQEPGLNPAWRLEFVDPKRFTSHAYLAYAYICCAINLHLNNTFIQIGRHEKRHLQEQLIQKFVSKMFSTDPNAGFKYDREDLVRVVSSWPKWFNTTDVIKNVKKLNPDFVRRHPIYTHIRWSFLR